MQKIYTTTTKIVKAIPKHLLIKRHTQILLTMQKVYTTPIKITKAIHSTF